MSGPTRSRGASERDGALRDGGATVSAWLLIGLVFLALYLWWRLMGYVMDRIARALSRTGPGAPMLDTAHGAAPFRCKRRNGSFGRKES